MYNLQKEENKDNILRFSLYKVLARSYELFLVAIPSIISLNYVSLAAIFMSGYFLF